MTFILQDFNWLIRFEQFSGFPRWLELTKVINLKTVDERTAGHQVDSCLFLFDYHIRSNEVSEIVPSDMCTQRRFRSDCAVAQSDQNLHWCILNSQDYKVSSCGQRRLIRLLMRRTVWVFVRRTRQKGRIGLKYNIIEGYFRTCWNVTMKMCFPWTVCITLYKMCTSKPVL